MTTDPRASDVLQDIKRILESCEAELRRLTRAGRIVGIEFSATKAQWFCVIDGLNDAGVEFDTSPKYDPEQERAMLGATYLYSLTVFTDAGGSDG